MSIVTRLYTSWKGGSQYCFNLGSDRSLTPGEVQQLQALLGEGFSGIGVSLESGDPEGAIIVELGPRPNFATPWSTNFVAQCQVMGLGVITRAECSRRYLSPPGEERASFLAQHHDRMTECEYTVSLTTFDTGLSPEAVFVIPLMEEGPDAFLRFDGLSGLTPQERQYYYDYFVLQESRNPTNVEMQALLNANSEHSRHGYFKGQQIIDGVQMPWTLMELVQSPYRRHPGRSVLAFADNSSGVKGFSVRALVPTRPGQTSSLRWRRVKYHIIATAETHNFPTGVAPVPGAETGAGGRIRDIQATGRGALIGDGATGYCVGQLLLPDYALPWEDGNSPYPPNLARPDAILIGASSGAFDYGNKFGEPVTCGFTRSVGIKLPGGARWEYHKPIMWTGGVGMLAAKHLQKRAAATGMLIVMIGGPAYRIGFGGGAASSMLQGDNAAHLDFNAVQRGDGEMKRKVDCVVQACVSLGAANPIESIHDQGAGGPANVLTELVEKSGGRIELRRIQVGDPTMSVVEIWVCEYQERLGLLVGLENLCVLQGICDRERVSCEVLGEVTGDGRFIVHDERDDSTPVDIDLATVLSGLPQKQFSDQRIPPILEPLRLPKGTTVEEALDRVLGLLSVASKQFLTRKVDRSVGGLVVRQQNCGPLQLPVADHAITALSFSDQAGSVMAIGENPLRMLVDPAVGARMAIGEALTNMASVKVRAPGDVFCSANWMWAPKLPGEGAALWDAALAMADLTTALGMCIPNRGKDSLSMATRVGDTMVKSPRSLVIYAYAPVPDVTLHVTPDIKRPGESALIHIDVANGQRRLGGSALAQVYSQLGDEAPDVDDPARLKRGFAAVQELVAKQLVFSVHDISDGGIIVTLLEMIFAGNCGLVANVLPDKDSFAELFAEELGWVVECGYDRLTAVQRVLDDHAVPFRTIGHTVAGDSVRITAGQETVLAADMPTLRARWEETGYRLERLQMNPTCADEERKNALRRSGPTYVFPVLPVVGSGSRERRGRRPKIAILREEGSNSFHEMMAAFKLADCDPWDVHMTDLINGKISLDFFQGLAAVGGFSYADVPASAKGWAATIRGNPELREMFAQFFARQDTFSLGICNGCQFFALLGIVPWAGIADQYQPRFSRNTSSRFESRLSTVTVQSSPAVLLQGLEGSVLGVWTAHGEGRLECPDPGVLEQIVHLGLAPVRYADDGGMATEAYPFNPNGSPYGIAGLCTPNGRHLAIMPHPERSFMDRQWGWMPEGLKSVSGFSPWMQVFKNARDWCLKVSR